MVALVPGHSPDSPGACGGGLCEWSWVLTVCHMAERRISASAVVQRESGLDELVQRLNDKAVEAVVSLHLNAHDGTVSGCETLHYPASAEGEGLAREIHPRIVRAMGGPNRGVKPRRDLAILSDTKAPAVLLEPAFIDNRVDREAALRNADVIADGIANGVRGWSYG
jgi:N-acetylmuramoyl-L-alanine amidase